MINKNGIARLVLCLFILVSTLGTGLVAAQGTTTSASNKTTTAGQSHDSAAAPKANNSSAASLLWQLLQQSKNPQKKTPTTILEQVTPTLWVTGYTFNKQDETVTITFSSRITNTVTVTDSSGIDPRKATGSTSMRSITIPRGTYKITVPATVNYQGNQLVTLSGSNGKLYWLSNKVVGSGSFFVGGARWSYVQLAFAVGLLFGALGIIAKAWRTIRGASKEIVRVF